jgi:hypothetical protein
MYKAAPKATLSNLCYYKLTLINSLKETLGPRGLQLALQP